MHRLQPKSIISETLRTVRLSLVRDERTYLCVLAGVGHLGIDRGIDWFVTKRRTTLIELSKVDGP